jgi:hypothetical protein
MTQLPTTEPANQQYHNNPIEPIDDNFVTNEPIGNKKNNIEWFWVIAWPFIFIFMILFGVNLVVFLLYIVSKKQLKRDCAFAGRDLTPLEYNDICSEYSGIHYYLTTNWKFITATPYFLIDVNSCLIDELKVNFCKGYEKEGVWMSYYYNMTNAALISNTTKLANITRSFGSNCGKMGSIFHTCISRNRLSEIWVDEKGVCFDMHYFNDCDTVDRKKNSKDIKICRKILPYTSIIWGGAIFVLLILVIVKTVQFYSRR